MVHIQHGTAFPPDAEKFRKYCGPYAKCSCSWNFLYSIAEFIWLTTASSMHNQLAKAAFQCVLTTIIAREIGIDLTYLLAVRHAVMFLLFKYNQI